MSEMVERVARAIYFSRPRNKAWEALGQHQGIYLKAARAAFYAMREPTPQMIETTVDFMFSVSLGGSYTWPVYARDVHCCMIDAALTPSQSSES
jgi:hypothetical protein